MNKAVILKDGKAYVGIWNYLIGKDDPDTAKWMEMTKPRVVPVDLHIEPNTDKVMEAMHVVQRVAGETEKRLLLLRGAMDALAEASVGAQNNLTEIAKPMFYADGKTQEVGDTDAKKETAQEGAEEML